MQNVKYIEVLIETHPVEDTYYTSYRKHIFFTYKNYNHKELSEIMKSINQKYYTDDVIGYGETEIDFKNLSNKLRDYEIYELIPAERFYFDIEED